MKKLYLDPLKNLKVALVHDDFTQFGGGESIFLAIKELFPTAAIYTSLVTKEWVKRIASSQQSGASSRKIFTSFMQKLPFKKKLQRAYFPLYPLAFESFDFSGFDLVISSSTRFAHGIITKPQTKHLCYMHSPGRMFWEPKSYFGEKSKLRILLSLALAYLRLWDFTAAQRVDQFLTNSKHTTAKIAKYYHREAKVIYPFVDLERFTPSVNGTSSPLAISAIPRFARNCKSSIVNGEETINHLPLTNYYLVVSRLTRWKRVDLAVKAALASNTPLKVVGDGPERSYLERLGKGRVEFLGWVSGEELAKLFAGCQALVMPQEEDFGITSLEAQASGRPVVAFKAGGALETIAVGKTGEFFYPQTVEALIFALKKFRAGRYDPQACRKNAERFSKHRFQEQFIKEVTALVNSE